MTMGYLVTEGQLTLIISLDTVNSVISGNMSLLAVNDAVIMGLDDLRIHYNRLPPLDQAME